jgi:hypothetical protein
MQVRIRQTGAVVFENEFRTYAQTQGAIFGAPVTEEFINQYGGDIVFEGPQATGGTVYQYSQPAGVEQIEGKWYTKYILGPVFVDGETPAAEQEAAYKALKDAERATAMRQQRTQMLKDSDWTQGKDIPDNISNAWAAHRQALRDITTQAGFPWTIDWPAQP